MLVYNIAHQTNDMPAPSDPCPGPHPTVAGLLARIAAGADPLAQAQALRERALADAASQPNPTAEVCSIRRRDSPWVAIKFEASMRGINEDK
jgi:hypothetical protein